MASRQPDSDTTHSIFSGVVRRALDHLLTLGLTRLQWALSELEEERRRWLRMWVAAMVILCAGLMTMALAVGWLLWRVDPLQRATVAGWLSLAFLGLTLLGAWVLRKELTSRRGWGVGLWSLWRELRRSHD
jgi:uncharacterized membrane protein YqjE